MSGGFFGRMLRSCQHQFTWPRRDESGDYYQLCVNCGSKYSYDWTKMKRIAKLDDSDASERPPISTARCNRKSAWSPRERRLKHTVPVSFQLTGSGEWQEGTCKNISRSGLMFVTTAAVTGGQILELKLAMPKELAGSKLSEVTCAAEVVRVSSTPRKGEEPEVLQVACSINGYQFEGRPISKPRPERANVTSIRRNQKRLF